MHCRLERAQYEKDPPDSVFTAFGSFPPSSPTSSPSVENQISQRSLLERERQMSVGRGRNVIISLRAHKSLFCPRCPKVAEGRMELMVAGPHADGARLLSTEGEREREKSD